MDGLLKKFCGFLIDAFFPQFCLGCGQEGKIVCEDCLSTIGMSEFNFCPFCEKPQRVFDSGKCVKHKFFKLDGIFSASSYKEKFLKELIIRFKYEPFLKTLAGPLASLIISHFLCFGNEKIYAVAENSIFVPVPLSKKRKRWRGYNQSKEIAKKLSDFYKIPLIEALFCYKKRQPQVGLAKEQRMENIRGVFAMKNSFDPEFIRDKIIFLVDDVFTTGATMEECAKVLKSAGAREVWGVTVAREEILS